MTKAKGLSNGSVPVGAVFASRAVHDGLMHGPEAAIELSRGYTYFGHPVACAAALACLDIYAEEGLLTRAADLAEYWEQAIHALKGISHIVDVRTIELVASIELASRPGEGVARAYEVFTNLFEQGLLIRVTGEIIALSPPLTIEKNQIDQISKMVVSAIKAVR